MSTQTLAAISQGRVNSITFFRLVAAWAVIYSHAFVITRSTERDWLGTITHYAHFGGLAVDFFFLLSGFLVCGSIKSSGVFRYSASRVLRLFPGLWFNLFIVVFVLGGIVTTMPLKEYLTHAQTWRYLSQIGLGMGSEWTLPGVFTGNRYDSMNGSIWSVIVEIRMYLYLAVAYMLGVLRNRVIFNVVFALISLLVWTETIHIPGVAGATDVHVALLFALGCFLYMNKELVTVSPTFVLSAVAIALVSIGTPNFQFGYILILVCLFILLAFMPTFSWVDRIGDYSYGIYLWGWPVQQTLVLIWPEQSQIKNALGAMVISTILAAISWHWIEKPMLSLKRFLRPRQQAYHRDGQTEQLSGMRG